jgi:hypothetical protein
MPKPHTSLSVTTNLLIIPASAAAAAFYWLKANRPVIGEQGDEYVTLNKGDLPAPDKQC